MSEKNTSFLIKCDRELNIVGIYWYNPVHLISPYQRNIKDLFEEPDAGEVHLLAKSIGRDQENLEFCKNKLKLVGSDIPISLCIMSLGDMFLIHGFEEFEIDDKSICDNIKGMIANFMRVILEFADDIATENEEMIRSQFEHIQKLNNELLNAQRQIKKANAKLNTLNKDLNNRLVKDSLTGLVSRYQYREEMELTISEKPDKLGIFLFIDIDDFKSINDNYGHGVGDIYLKTFADRLKNLDFQDAVYMRIAGDEFGIYTHGYESVDDSDLEGIWKDIREKVIDRPVELDGGIKLNVSCSVGMSIYGEDSSQLFDLIEYADFAMYNAKNTGKNTYRRFNYQKYLRKKNSNF